MTQDVIALTQRMPDARAIVAALLAAGPDLRLQSIADGAVLQLCDNAGRPLLSVEAPLLLQVPGETARLLGPETAYVPTPIWWTEARASTAVPQAETLAAVFASHLARHLDGTVWPKTATVPVPTPTEPPKGIEAPSPAAAQPAVDVLTDRVAVVIQDRPVIPMTAWLSDALRACLAGDRGLQIVTPAHARLSLPTRTLLSGLPSRWVVRDDTSGYYDGLSGAVLHWHGGAFVPIDAPDGTNTPVAPAFTKQASSGETQLVISLRTQHPADEHLLLGGALEALWQNLTGHPPTGWGTAEPANQPWSRSEITELARRRVPNGTWIVAVGTHDRPAIATTRIARTTTGVEEDITLALGYAPDEPVPVDALPNLAAELTSEHNAQSVLIQRRAARRDLSIPARFEAFPSPLAFALGSDAVQEVGVVHARRPPIPGTPQPLGTAGRPGFFYSLDDGTSAGGWRTFEQLMRHLRVDPSGHPDKRQ